MKSKAYVSVYLLLMKNDQLLLSLRSNTGYEDNKWALVAGHQETGEAATVAMLREAKEEIGIDIKEEDLQVLHVMHRNSNRENIDIFMKCTKWKGDIENKEPEKCGGLAFYPLDAFPSNTVQYMKEAIEMAFSNVIFSERGWENSLHLDRELNYL